jgi:ubiquinone/menaquinone biosynthesis C-methylase UbiE
MRPVFPNKSSTQEKAQVTTKSRYLLPWDEFEKKRLNLQQSVVLRWFEDRILAPAITVGDHDNILDVGCGTGIWSVDLAARLPCTVHFEACDFSSQNFLDIEPLGITNVNFSTHSVLSLPQEWTGNFTVIHQRLLHPSITIAEWPRALREHMRLLKPGGWLQLVEIDLSSFFNDGIDSVSNSTVPAQAELCAYWKEVFNDADMLWELEAGLPKLLEEAGFENVEWNTRVFSTEGALADNSENGHGSLADDTLACMVNVIKSYKPRIVGTGKITSERFDTLIEEMKMAWKDVPKTEKGNGWTWHMISAQKPRN